MEAKKTDKIWLAGQNKTLEGVIVFEDRPDEETSSSTGKKVH